MECSHYQVHCTWTRIANNSLALHCRYYESVICCFLTNIQWNNAVDFPSDAQKIQKVKLLVDNGYTHRILLSHDIHSKHRLVNKLDRLHGYIHLKPFSPHSITYTPRCATEVTVTATFWSTLYRRWRIGESPKPPSTKYSQRIHKNGYPSRKKKNKSTKIYLYL